MPPVEVRHALEKYLRWGGFPEIVLARDDRRREVLLRQYFDDVLFKDVALRHRVRDIGILRALAVHLLTTTAGLVSLQRLAAQFEVSLDLTRSYRGFLEEAFLLRFLSFFSLKAAVRQRRPRKVHAVDLGLRNAVCLSTTSDHGHLAETAVANALDGTPHDGLFYWKGKHETDLVVRQGGRAAAVVQVALEAERQRLYSRERASLEEAQANFPKANAVLVVGGNPPSRVRGGMPDVRLVPLWRFLLEPGTASGETTYEVR